MITRHGKIARLPNDIREELNQRLFNGAMGPELLAWLNQQPAVNEVSSQFFNGAPVNPQNLSDWRRGGYQDWLRHQERELRIQRIAEQGVSLKQQEGDEDLFENSARIAVAELMVDMDSLHKKDDKQRWNRLRELTRELVRLQNAYNRSRWAELAWTKRNDQFEDIPESSQEPEHASQSEPPPSTLDPRLPTPITVDQGVSNGEGETDKRVWVTRVIHRRKGCGCICRNCHPDDGEYPYAEAIRDAAEAKQRGALCFWRGLLCINTEPTDCDCVCVDCENGKRRNGASAPPGMGRDGALAPSAPRPAAQLPEPPKAERQPSNEADQEKVRTLEKAEPNERTARVDPVADFLRQTAHWRERCE
jgi:hypothetical protein